MRPITLQEAEYVAHRLVAEMMNYDEPIGDFSTRYPHRLESCLEQPFQRFNGLELYESLYEKAALLFYLVIKNHPFENGNKRMAVMLLIYFLLLNKKWVNTSPDDLYNVAIRVAESKPEQKDLLVDALIEAMEQHARDFTDEEVTDLEIDKIIQ